MVILIALIFGQLVVLVLLPEEEVQRCTGAQVQRSRC
jgi:hypothetical protein